VMYLDPRDAYENYRFPIMHVGMRVRLRAPAWGLKLRSDTGTVMGPAEDDGDYVVRLDVPALFDHGTGLLEELEEIVEASDNMDVLEG
jgi:hypothetical protein